MANKPLHKSKTVWGGLIIGVTHILGVAAPAALSGVFGPKAQGIATGLGIILGAVGVRSALNPPKP